MAIALYDVPAANDAGNHQNILWRQDMYQPMEWVFIGTGTGERFAHDPRSPTGIIVYTDFARD